MWWNFVGKLSVNFPKRSSLETCNRNLHHILHCEKNLRLRNAVIPRKRRRSAKLSDDPRKTANLAPFVPFSLSLLIPLENLFPVFRERASP